MTSAAGNDEPRLLPFGATNDNLTMVISNQGGGTLDWSVTTSGAPWLSVVPPASGSTPAGETDPLQIVIDHSGLAVGKHAATVTVTPAGGTPVVVPVEAAVAAGVPAGPSLVTVENRRLVVRKRLPDGTLDLPRPYRVRGFAWSPASVETSGAFASRRQAFLDWYATDLGMIRGAFANTVYVFLDFGLDPAEYRPVLDSAYAKGIMVIMTIDEDGTYNQSRAESVVAAYKDHPAILMWAIGNEWNINLFHDRFATVMAAAQAVESLAQGGVCLGGTVFAYGDEWWKVSPPGQHDADGFFTD